jgi:hypothetical protein
LEANVARRGPPSPRCVQQTTLRLEATLPWAMSTPLEVTRLVVYLGRLTRLGSNHLK